MESYQCQPATKARRTQTCTGVNRLSANGKGPWLQTQPYIIITPSVVPAPWDDHKIGFTYRVHCISEMACLAADSPANEVTGRLVPKCCIANEADGRIEEGRRDDAQHCGFLHLCVLSRVLDCVLHGKMDIDTPFRVPHLSLICTIVV